MLKEGIFTLSFLSSIALAIVVPVAPYIGKNNPSRRYNNKHTAALIDSKIYFFGGTYALPYIVDPYSDNGDAFMYNEHRNVTDLSYVYDTISNEWNFETKTPDPWTRANHVVVDTDIYFFNILSDFSHFRNPLNMRLHKYDTLTKEWSRKSDIEFLWDDDLKSCYMNGNIYFANGGYRGSGRTIIHSYNVGTDQWDEDILFPKDRLTIDKMLCTEDSIKVIAEKIDVDPLTGEYVEKDPYHRYPVTPKKELFSIGYDGNTVALNLNVEEFDYGSEIAYTNEWFYIYRLNQEKASISRINTVTLESEIIESALPYNFSAPLIVPTKYNDVFLFGGESNPIFRNDVNVKSLPKVKRWNHKVVKSSSV